MKLKKNLVLLGMMGAGKSSIGFLISKKLNIKFIDIDKVIEKEENMKISDIFKNKSEKYFRNLEEKTTLKMLNSENKVIALGGGAFINDKIRKTVLNNDFSIWLNWDTQTLLDRIKNSKKRPIAINSNDSEIKELISKRSKIYSLAKFKVNCQKLTKNQIIKKILKRYENN